VHHGIVRTGSIYPWCSAGWFERVAEPSFQKTVAEFTKLNLGDADDFEIPPLEDWP
jgi:putative transposase